MLIAFVCRSCGAELTDFLTEADATILDPTNLNGAMLPRGKFVRVVRTTSMQEFYRITFASEEAGAVVTMNPGDFIVNVADLQHQMHPNAKFGCCGYEGAVEANARCQNGHDVATVHSDCWHAAFARLIGEFVECVVD